MTTPFSFGGTLTYPPSTGQPNASRTFNLAGNYNVKAEYEYLLEGSGTKVVDFGSVELAKAVLVVVASDAAAPVVVKLNGSSDGVELSAGGFMCLGSPNPDDGIEALSIVHTDDAGVNIYILG